MKYLSAFLLIASSAFGDEAVSSCNAPEVIGHQKIRYNDLVCEGALLQNQGKLTQAINVFNEALSQDLFEEPNVYLYPRLSFLYSKTNQPREAMEYLERAKLSIEVLFGIAHCDMDYEFTEGIDLEEVYDSKEIGIVKGGIRIESNFSKEIFFKVCQQNIVDYYLQNSDLDIIINNPIIEWYEKALIEVKK